MMMKTILRISFALAAGVLILNSCKKGPADIMNDFDLHLGTELIKYRINGNIKDLENLSAVPTNAKIFVEGNDAEYIYDATTGKKEVTVNADGSFSLGVHPNYEPVGNQPLEFSILVMADNYIATSREVQVNEGEVRQRIDLGMMSYSNPPDYIDLKVQNFNLNNGEFPTDMIAKGKQATDSVYYDDGLTTVVMTKGTKFYYYNYEKTGTALRPTGEVRKVVDTVTVNGETNTVTRKEQILDTADVFGFVKRVYTNNSLEIIAYYSKGRDLNYRVHEHTANSEKNIDVLKENAIPVKNLLFESAVEKRLFWIEFRGMDSEGKPMELYPFNAPGKPRWFTSFVVDPSVTNPVTNAPVQEGDSIEVGFDVNTGKSMREVVKLAKNGQLRVETQQVNAGYYFRAMNTYNISYRLDASKPASVPDVENLGYDFVIELGNAKLYRRGYGAYERPIVMDYTISTKDAVSMEGRLYSRYCYEYIDKAKPYNTFSGEVNVYDDAKIRQKFPHEISFEVTMLCPEGKVVVKPSYFGTFTTYSPWRRLYVDMRDGRWATRGIKLGEEYVLHGQVGGSIMDTVLTVANDHNIIEYQLGNNPGAICP